MEERVDLVLQAIEKKQVTETIEMEDIAREVGLSAERFRHLFREETKLTFHKYLRRRLMIRAAELLLNPVLNINEVMDKLECEDTRQFRRDFQKTFGLSPGGYRRASVKPPMPALPVSSRSNKPEQ